MNACTVTVLACTNADDISCSLQHDRPAVYCCQPSSSYRNQTAAPSTNQQHTTCMHSIDLKISTTCCIICVLAGNSLVYSFVYSVCMRVFCVFLISFSLFCFFFMCMHVCASSTISIIQHKNICNFAKS